MLESLPAPDDAILAVPSAQVVTFAISVEEERSLRPADGIAWQRALTEHGFETSVLQKVVQRNISVNALVAGAGAQVAPSIEARDGWLAIHRNFPSKASLFREGLSLERQSYPGFSEFRKEIEAVCRAIADVLHPSLRTRLNLRYSNALSTEKAVSAAYWRGKVSPAFLGIGADERLGTAFQRTFSVIDFVQDDITLQVRSGLQPDAVYPNAVAFVFDVDVSNAALVEFNVESCLAQTDDLNRYARQMFQAILTKEQFKKMKAKNA